RPAHIGDNGQCGRAAESSALVPSSKRGRAARRVAAAWVLLSVRDGRSERVQLSTAQVRSDRRVSGERSDRGALTRPIIKASDNRQSIPRLLESDRVCNEGIGTRVFFHTEV